MNYDIPEWLRYDMKRRSAKRLAERRAKLARKVRGVVIGALIALTLGAILLQPYELTYERPDYVIPDPCGLEVVICEGEEIPYIDVSSKTVYAHVTWYNTVPEQTDSTPCIAASGDNICGRDDVVACPTYLPLGTIVEIDGKDYTCLDRTNTKYNGRYDISCDKDDACPYQVTGRKEVVIK